MYFTCDDICVAHKEHLYKLENIKKDFPGFMCTLFVIAGDLDKELKGWLQQDWIEVGCHGWLHDDPPECERDDREMRIVSALKEIKDLLPYRYGFRAPGFQMTASTYPIINRLGFWYIAHQTRVQPLRGKFTEGLLVNSHIYDELKVQDGVFEKITEGFDHHAHTRQRRFSPSGRGHDRQVHR